MTSKYLTLASVLTMALSQSATAFTTASGSFARHVSVSNVWGKCIMPTLQLSSATAVAVAVAGTEALATYEKNLNAMRAKDKTSKSLSKADLKVVFDDEHIVVVDKPSGVLCVPDKAGNPSLAASVFDAFGCESGVVDKMVAQRLGFDTSGLIVFAKTNKAITGLNSSLRSRKMNRKYEALLCGHVVDDAGEISFTLTRDAAALPFMRVYTEDSQKALIEAVSDLPAGVGKSLCRNEQPSVTKYEVIAKEELNGNPVSRVILNSVSGRTHQLNVHCAAFGHPIVGDTTYGINGRASPNGGLSKEEIKGMSSAPASTDLQESIASTAKSLCVHLTKLGFNHPVTGKELSFLSRPPF